MHTCFCDVEATDLIVVSVAAETAVKTTEAETTVQTKTAVETETTVETETAEAVETTEAQAAKAKASEAEAEASVEGGVAAVAVIASRGHGDQGDQKSEGEQLVHDDCTQKPPTKLHSVLWW